jgi:hypothetical protein
MPKLWYWLEDLWFQRCRRKDLDILWPLCKQNARDLEGAKLAFALHTATDPAWQQLGPRHVSALIDALE